MSLIDLVRPYKSIDVSGFIPVKAGSETIGLVPGNFARSVAALNDTWLYRDDSLTLNPQFDSFDARTKAVDESCFLAMANGLIPPKPDYPHGDDWFGIGKNRQIDPLFIMRRFFVVCFGIEFDTVIVNGFEQGQLWVAVRGTDVDTAPGKLDTMIAGAFHHGQTPVDALLYEGEQEASLTSDWLDKIDFVKKIQVSQKNKHGFLRDEIFYIYDFDTRGQFVPVTNMDWEVHEFKKMPYDDILPLLATGINFKGEIHLTKLDFLLRHGFLDTARPEHAALEQLINESKDFYA
jgi:isopentenyldiphosphate isomerase